MKSVIHRSFNSAIEQVTVLPAPVRAGENSERSAGAGAGYRILTFSGSRAGAESKL